MMLRLLVAALMLLLGLPEKASAAAGGSVHESAATTGDGSAALVPVTSSPASVDTRQMEDACCAAILLQDGAAPLGDNGKYLLPVECRKHEVSCPTLGFSSPPGASVGDDPEATVDEVAASFLELQLALRAATTTSCPADQWLNRCPPGSAMLLASTRRGCRSAGCVAVQGDLASAVQPQQESQLDREATLRAVVFQEAARLEASSSRKSPHMHCLALKASFVKAQRRLLKELAMAMKATPFEMQSVRALVKTATLRGFGGGRVPEAKAAIAQHDAAQKRLSDVRDASVAWLSEMARRALVEKRRIAARQYSLKISLDNARAEASAHAKTVEDQRQVAIIEAHRVERALESVQAGRDAALESRDKALAKAASASAEAASTAHALEKQNHLATLMQNSLTAEVDRAHKGWEQSRAEAATLSRTIDIQHREAMDETARFADTTKHLEYTIERLTESVSVLTQANANIEESFSSARSVWEIELGAAVQSMQAAGARASVLHEALNEHQRAADTKAEGEKLALQSMTGHLDSVMRARDDAVAQTEDLKLIQTNLEAEVERALSGWEACRMDAARLHRILAEQDQHVFAEAGRYQETVEALTATVTLLRGTIRDHANLFVSAKDSWRGEYGSALASTEAANRRAEEMSMTIFELTNKEPLESDSETAEDTSDTASPSNASAKPGESMGRTDDSIGGSPTAEEMHPPEGPHGGDGGGGGGGGFEGAAWTSDDDVG